MPTLNYTTTISAATTATEIQALLGQHGASAVVVQYTDRRVTGISFSLTGPHGARAFTLPVDVDAMSKVLRRQHINRQVAARYATPEQAERVAWRVIKDWLVAQLALVEAQMASLDQVMLPYLHVDGQITLYEAYRQRDLAALTAGPS